MLPHTNQLGLQQYRALRSTIVTFLATRLTEVIVVIALAGATYSDLSRFEGPVHERYVPSIVQPGGIDFAAPYLATMAYLRGANPYHHNIAELKDPLHRDQDVFNGHRYDFVYGPTHLLPYVPIAYLTHGNWHHGHRAWFRLNLLWCVLLAWVMALIIAERRSSMRVEWMIVMGLAAALALSPPLNMLLERGQSDLFVSLLCWTSVWCALRRAWGWAVWLCLFSVLMKPYALPLLFGLIAFAVVEKAWRRLATGLLATSVYLLPVWRFIPVALQASFDRSQFFGDHWTNHSFLRLFRVLGLSHPEQAKWLAVLLGALTCAVLGLRYLLPPHHDAQATIENRKRTLIYFACASLALSLGASNTSILYNLIVIAPGLLILTLAERPDTDRQPSSRGQWALWGIALSACMTLFWAVPQDGDLLPTPAIALIMVFVFTLARTLGDWRLHRLGLGPNKEHIERYQTH